MGRVARLGRVPRVVLVWARLPGGSLAKTLGPGAGRRQCEPCNDRDVRACYRRPAPSFRLLVRATGSIPAARASSLWMRPTRSTCPFAGNRS